MHSLTRQNGDRTVNILKNLLIAAFLMCGGASFAQTIENVNAEFRDQKVYVTYDLLHSDSLQSFYVSFYSSHNNYTTPIPVAEAMQKTLPGRSRRAELELKNLFPSGYEGDVTIKVKASVKLATPAQQPTAVATSTDVAKLKLTALDNTSYKRGKTMSLRWSENAPVKVELMQNGVVQLQLAQVTSNRFEWAIPRDTKTGKDYSIRVSRLTNSADASTSDAFRIKPKIPLMVKMLPLVAGGVIMYLVTRKPGNGPSKQPDENLTELPGPIKPN